MSNVDAALAGSDMYGAENHVEYKLMETEMWPALAKDPRRYIKGENGVVFKSTALLEREVSAGRLTALSDAEVDQYLESVKDGKPIIFPPVGKPSNKEKEEFLERMAAKANADLVNSAVKKLKK